MLIVAFWAVVAAIVIVESLIILAALRVPPASRTSGSFIGSRGMEVFWTLLPALLLLGIVALSYNALRGPDGDGDGGSIATTDRAIQAPLYDRTRGGSTDVLEYSIDTLRALPGGLR